MWTDGKTEGPRQKGGVREVESQVCKNIERVEGLPETVFQRKGGGGQTRSLMGGGKKKFEAEHIGSVMGAENHNGY